MEKKKPETKVALSAKDMAAFKRSKYDNDVGVKPGSAADKKRDAKEIPAFLKGKK